MKMIKFGLILCGLFLIGCGNQIEHSREYSLETFNYFYDSETDLCFVARGYYTTYSMSYVPCTDKVMNRIKTKGISK